ncbi:hypothetical protein [Salinarchaeum laminariae]|uniref:hypothetical protein n=1 Tax=Salinarchaeum laminariae TaxID=869888 RepID=UPI0020BF9A16|nr:hypothetical protein [Salinarchaeum laminariae]
MQHTADHWYAEESLPADTTWPDVEEYLDRVHDSLNDRIESYAEETALTDLEAVTWVLQNTAVDHTWLTDDAIAFTLAVNASPFGTHQPDADSRVASSPTPNEIREVYERAERKHDEAEEFLGLESFPEREQSLDNPLVVWLDSATIRRLQDAGEEPDGSLNDVVNRLLDESETHRSLEEFLRAYLEERGEDNVHKVTIQTTTDSNTLSLIGHADIQHDVPDVVRNTDAITIDDEEYRFLFDEDPDWPSDQGRTVLYCTLGEDDDLVDLGDGLETARNEVES